MKQALIIGLLILPLLFSNMTKDISAKADFTEKEILNQLDIAFQGIPSGFYPVGKISSG